MMITCRDFIGFLADYLAGELPVQQQAVFEEHLVDCPDCLAYLRSYAATIKLGKAAFADLNNSVPAEVPERLVKAILATQSKSP